MKKFNFQTIVLLVFGLIFILAIMVFAGLFGDAGRDGELGTRTVVVWGAFEQSRMDRILVNFFDSRVIQYEQKNSNTFDQDLVEAIAAGRGPDLVFLPQELILQRQGSLALIPYEAISQREFRDTFIEQGEVYLRPEGILALPFYIDPMVMYWNRNMFTANSIVRAPVNWNEVITLAPILTRRTDGNEIQRSAIAFGEFQNVRYAKDLLVMLMIQTGNPILLYEGSSTTSLIQGNRTHNIPSTAEALRFYTDFADPTKQVYSWSRSLPDSRDMFLSQNLGMYFGYASEFETLQRQNPLLNFDVAKVPQVADGNFHATVGRIYGLALLQSSQNKQAALEAARIMTSRSFAETLANESILPPVHRSLLANAPSDAFRRVFYESALISRGWRDPEASATNRIFREAVENIVSGRFTVDKAVQRLHEEMVLILR